MQGEDELKYQIALTLIPQIGDVLAKKLLHFFGTARNVFEVSAKELAALPKFGAIRAKAVRDHALFDRAEREIAFIKKQGITPLFYTDDHYPRRLKYCVDSPVMVYYKGTADLNTAKVLSIVGTRHATDYGKAVCERILSGLKDLSLVVVSGLAYGIDITAHKAALKYDIPTVGVVAHGLDRLYPQAHLPIARDMLANGGLLTDFRSGTKPDKQNFPMRNRIVAGLADATLVIETGKKGGSLITAEIANSYNRDVFAIPGRVQDKRSEGCNYLIHRNKAALVTDAASLMHLMGWEGKAAAPQVTQQTLFAELDDKEKAIVQLLTGRKAVHIDDLRMQSKFSTSEVAAAILNLELQGIIQSLPGKQYKLL